MNNSRVVKRKVNASGAKIEPPKKALKKTELVKEFHALQEELTRIKEENRILIENQKKHIEAIHLLEETITVLQSKKNDSEKEHKKTIDNLEETVKELKSKCSNRSVYLCGECDYLADCVQYMIYFQQVGILGRVPLSVEWRTVHFRVKSSC